MHSMHFVLAGQVPSPNQPVFRHYDITGLQQGRARRRDVQIGLREPGLVEVRAGLEPGERVVRSGHMQLSNGDPVRVVERAAAR